MGLEERLLCGRRQPPSPPHRRPQGAAAACPQAQLCPGSGARRRSESPPLLSSLPAASLARGGRNNWCVGGVGAAACALLCCAASLRLGTATTASLWPAARLRTAKGRVGGTYPVPAPSPYAPITGVSREHPRGVCPPAVGLGLGRVDTGRGKDPGSICQRHGGGWLGRAGGPQHTPVCVLPQALQLSLASSLAAGSGVGVPEPIWQQRQEPLTSCPRCHPAPSLTSTPASVSLPGRGLGAEPGPEASSDHHRDLVEKLPAKKPLNWGLSPSPNAEIPSPGTAAGKWVKALARGGIFPSV